MADEKDLDKSLRAAGHAGKHKVSAPTPPKKPGIANVAKTLAPSVVAKPAVKPVTISDAFEFDTSMHMAFLGAGQGGGKIAQAFWNLGYRRVAAFNTTENDFAGLDPDMPKYSTHTSGAAKDMELARQALKGREEDVWDLFTRGWGDRFDCALVCASLGGGTGSGTVAPLIKLARRYMETNNLPPRVGALVSLPFVTEGQQIARNAVNAFRELLEAKVSPLLVIDNDRVDEVYNHPSMKELLPKSNATVSGLLHLFNQLAATKSEHVTFDRAEFAQLLDDGIIAMGSADIDVSSIRSPADISGKIRDELANSVLAKVDLTTGKKAACVFVASDEVLSTFGRPYFDAGFTTLNRIVGSAYPDADVVIHRGLYAGSDDGLQCYTMISGLEPPAEKLRALAKEAGIKTEAGSVAKHLRVD